LSNRNRTHTDMEPVVGAIEEKMESDVLELDVPCSDDLNEAPKAAAASPPSSTAPMEPAMNKEDDQEQLANSRLLWISGIDETMKANDFRVAFEPHGKGMGIEN